MTALLAPATRAVGQVGAGPPEGADDVEPVRLHPVEDGVGARHPLVEVGVAVENVRSPAITTCSPDWSSGVRSDNARWVVASVKIQFLPGWVSQIPYKLTRATEVPSGGVMRATANWPGCEIAGVSHPASPSRVRSSGSTSTCVQSNQATAEHQGRCSSGCASVR